MALNCRKIRSMLALFLLSISWGMTGCFRRLIENEFSPLQQLAASSAIACAFVTAYAALNSSRPSFPRLTSNAWLALHIRVLIGGVLAIALMFLAYSNAKVAHVSWISSLPLTVVWALVLGEERVKITEIIVLIIGFVGVLQLSNSEQSLLSLGSGELLALAGTLFYSLGLIVSRKLVREIGVQSTTSWVLLLTTIYAALFSLILDDKPPVVTTDGLLIIGVSGASVALNSIFQFYGFTYLRATLATSIANLKILWAPIFAFCFFGELPLVNGWLGGGIILLSVALSTLIKSSPSSHLKSGYIAPKLNFQLKSPVLLSTKIGTEICTEIGTEGS